MSNKRIFPSINIGIILLIAGLISSGIAIDYQNYVATIFGVTLVLWGGILFYVRPENYIKSDVLQNSCNNLYSIVETLFKELSIIDKPIYFIEGSLEGLTNVYVKISTSTRGEITLTPPGQNLHRLLETALNENFSSVDIFKISPKFSKSIVEFNMATFVKMVKNVEDNNVVVTITDNLFTRNTKNEVWKYVGDPLTSAIACSIARSTGKNIIIENFKVEDNVTEIIFHILE